MEEKAVHWRRIGRSIDRQLTLRLSPGGGTCVPGRCGAGDQGAAGGVALAGPSVEGGSGSLASGESGAAALALALALAGLRQNPRGNDGPPHAAVPGQPPPPPPAPPPFALDGDALETSSKPYFLPDPDTEHKRQEGLKGRTVQCIVEEWIRMARRH
jgi:hypothetical protein